MSLDLTSRQPRQRTLSRPYLPRDSAHESRNSARQRMSERTIFSPKRAHSINCVIAAERVGQGNPLVLVERYGAATGAATLRLHAARLLATVLVRLQPRPLLSGGRPGLRCGAPFWPGHSGRRAGKYRRHFSLKHTPPSVDHPSPLQLCMDGFLIPANESVAIIRDNDTLE